MPRLKTRSQKLRAFVAGAIVVIGGGAGGLVVIHPGGTATPCTTSDASGCVASTQGTFVTWTNPTLADSAGNWMLNCTMNALAYAQHASDSTHHFQATVTKPVPAGPDYPVHFVVNFTGTNTMTIKVGLNFNNGCTGQGGNLNTTMSAASAGATSITLASSPTGVAGPIIAGTPLQIGTGTTEELITVGSISGTSVVLSEPLQHNHLAGDRIRAILGIDVVVDVDGDGISRGFGEDISKVGGYAGCSTSATAQDPNHDGSGSCAGLNISGDLNAGPGAPITPIPHPDCIQVLGSVNASLIDITCSDWANKIATIDGAGGALYLNAVGSPPSTVYGWPDNLAVERYRGLACNKGLNIKIANAGGPPVNPQWASAIIRHSEFRAGQTTAAVPAPTGSQCNFSTGAFNSGSNYAAGLQSFATECPLCFVGTSQSVVTDVLADQWAQTGQSWSPGFNPNAFPSTGFP